MSSSPNPLPAAPTIDDLRLQQNLVELGFILAYTIKSRNPLILRILDNLNQIAVRGGIYVSLGVVAGLGVSFLASIYALSTYYGAHAVRVFVGDRMYNIIIGDDPQNWHWSVYWNLPLVPLYLIAADPISLSSSLSSSASFLFSNISLPLILSLGFPSTSVLAASHKNIDLSNLSNVLSPSSNHHLYLRHFFSYPPPPSLCLLTFPFIRAVYVSMRWRLIRWVLTLPKEAGRLGAAGEVGRPVWVIGGDDENEDDDGDAEEGGIGADIRIDVDIDRAANENEDGPQDGGRDVVEQRQDNQQPQQPQQQVNQVQNQNINIENNRRNDNPNELQNQARNQGGRRVRLTFSSIGRYLSRVLLTPWIASYSGKVLELISRRWGFLRLILAIDTNRANDFRGIATGTTAVGIGRVMEWIRRITGGGSQMLLQSVWKASTVEPIWQVYNLRNLSLFFSSRK
ncbi:hypothetical protein Clacol_003577 [Clathrus columnatus]|uniref:Uncharacterized protein n=1 Tax=Clathrus columnatus TaxID=1419009 RepID=A0AAV5ABQ0_9AGAM|nr:hypothetical protein Clacol_003577 [Clathrus columnatus]